MAPRSLRLSFLLLVICGVVACDDGDDPVDAGGGPPLRDASADGALDPDRGAVDMRVDPMLDAMADARPDMQRDAMADAMLDAMPDAMPDAMLDAMVDAMLDATADAIVDMELDAMPDMAEPDRGMGECVPAGESVAVVPGALPCCPGLEGIGCDRPVDGACERCLGARICAACGDGVCGAGENPCNCPVDCDAAGPCDDGGPIVCAIDPPPCRVGEILAVQDGCYRCVDPATCRPFGEPGCAGDDDCEPGEICDPCGSASCPDCDDCVPACGPRGGCPGPNPAGCRQTGCPAGQACVQGDACIPSSCQCDGDLWICTEDCGGGVCVEQAALQWFETCGDPVCRGHVADPNIPPCAADERPGDRCGAPDTRCDPIDDCNVRLVCAAEDPRMGPCPISRAEHKRDIRYLDPAERRRYAAALLDTRLATWRYRAAPAARPSLGFIIDDGMSPEAVTADGERVDLYGYTSLAVAAVQVQAEEIAALRAELAALRARLDALEAR